MIATAGSSRPGPEPTATNSVRLAVVGTREWLARSAPASVAGAHALRTFATDALGGAEPLLEELARFAPHASVVLDAAGVEGDLLGGIPGATLGVLVDGLPEHEPAGLGRIDRLVTFQPALTGATFAGREIWRAIPPPVSDALFAEPRAAIGPPRAVTIGAATPHREWLLIGAKHHHDVLELITGAYEPEILALYADYDVGIYVPREPGGGFGPVVGEHLAAGRLLLSGELVPAHGLERGIDYLQVDTPDGLVWLLDRMGRFPSMYRRVRIRGRMKAEQYRSSRLFARLLHDLLADVAAFG